MARDKLLSNNRQVTEVSENRKYAVRIDEQGTTTYFGYALPGAATNRPEWQVFRMVESGADSIITYADGNENFDNIWDNRASLSYS